MRIKGWLGRADQTTKIKGMFVHPEQIAEIARRHPELGRLRLVAGDGLSSTRHGTESRAAVTGPPRPGGRPLGQL